MGDWISMPPVTGGAAALGAAAGAAGAEGQDGEAGEWSHIEGRTKQGHEAQVGRRPSEIRIIARGAGRHAA